MRALVCGHRLRPRYRIEHACRLLHEQPRRSVLDISLDAGFGSLGPFNRAFKAATGGTPSAWRAQSLRSTGSELPDCATLSSES